MKRESVFRSITAALLVTAAAISVYHRHRAEQAGGEEIFRARGDALGRGLPSQPALDEVVQPGPAGPSALVGCRARNCVPGPRALDLSHHRQEHNVHGRDEGGARARHRRPVPLGETSPLHGRDLILHVAWQRGCELVCGAGKPCGTGDALDPAAQRGGEADREVRRRVPRLHGACRKALTTYRARLGRKSWFSAWLIWPVRMTS